MVGLSSWREEEPPVDSSYFVFLNFTSFILVMFVTRPSPSLQLKMPLPSEPNEKTGLLVHYVLCPKVHIMLFMLLKSKRRRKKKNVLFIPSVHFAVSFLWLMSITSRKRVSICIFFGLSCFWGYSFLFDFLPCLSSVWEDREKEDNLPFSTNSLSNKRMKSQETFLYSLLRPYFSKVVVFSTFVWFVPSSSSTHSKVLAMDSLTRYS